MKVSVEIDQTELEGDYAYVDGLRVTCSRCAHFVEVFGTSGDSARRAAATLNEECPRGENNFYDVDWWS